MTGVRLELKSRVCLHCNPDPQAGLCCAARLISNGDESHSQPGSIHRLQLCGRAGTSCISSFSARNKTAAGGIQLEASRRLLEMMEMLCLETQQTDISFKGTVDDEVV